MRYYSRRSGDIPPGKSDTAPGYKRATPTPAHQNYYWFWFPVSAAALAMLIVHFRSADQVLFHFINQWSIYTGETLWADVTILGDTLVTAVLVLPWLKRRPDMIWSAVFAGLLAVVISQGLKSALAVPRPPAVLQPENMILIGPAYRADSFPSGHATTIFTFASLIIFFINSRLSRWMILLFSVFVALSRVAIGVHWPEDILGGMLTGWFSSFAGIALYHRIKSSLPAINPVWISAVIAGGAIVLIFFHDTHYPSAYWLQVSVGISAIMLSRPAKSPPEPLTFSASA